MGWKIFFSFLFIFFAVLLLILYWFVPLGDVVTFGVKSKNSNFSLNGDENMQFYSNMRFQDSEISYKIYNCPLKEENDMQYAFEIVSNKTLMKFYKLILNVGTEYLL